MSGKTTLSLHFAAECQRTGGTVAFIDAEHALDVSYATKLGVDVPNLLISQPDCGEQALEIAEMLIRSKSIGILIIDSVAALTPRKEIEGEMGDAHMGLQARMMSQAMRKLTAAIAQSNTTVIFTNQLRCVDKNSLIVSGGRLWKAKEIISDMSVLRSENKENKVIEVFNSGLVDGIEIMSKYRSIFKISNRHLQPIICKKDLQVDGRTILQRGALYLRKDSAESTIINTSTQMRELLSRALKHRSDELLKTINILLSGQNPSESTVVQTKK